MGHLLHRGENERGEAFPLWLPQDAQSPTGLGRFHDDGVSTGGADGIEIMVECHVVAHLLFGNPGILEARAILAKKDSAIPDASDEAEIKRGPVKGLSTVQGRREIQLRGHDDAGVGTWRLPHRAK